MDYLEALDYIVLNTVAKESNIINLLEIMGSKKAKKVRIENIKAGYISFMRDKFKDATEKQKEYILAYYNYISYDTKTELIKPTPGSCSRHDFGVLNASPGRLFNIEFVNEARRFIMEALTYNTLETFEKVILDSNTVK